MIKFSRAVLVVFGVGLLLSLLAVQGFGVQESKSKNSGMKEIVGKWSGAAIQDGESDTVQVTIELRLDGNRIAGDVHSPAGEMKVTNVTYTNGKWAISCVSADGVEAKINCSIKNEKLVGEWTFGPNTGKFEFAREKS